MSAFQTKRAYQIKNVIRRLQSRIINSHRTDLTPNDLLELYVKPTNREILTRVFTLVQMHQDSIQIVHPVNAGGNSATLAIYITFASGDVRWLVPTYADKGPIGGANPEIKTKFDLWVERRFALGVECAMVEALFDELNWRCNAVQLKFFMPSIIDILDLIEDDVKVATQREKLSMAKIPAIPSLPLGMDDALEGVRATVARARLMDKKSEEEPASRVKFRLVTGPKGAVETPWGTALSVV